MIMFTFYAPSLDQSLTCRRGSGKESLRDVIILSNLTKPAIYGMNELASRRPFINTL